MEPSGATHVPLQLTGGAIVASIQLDLTDEVMLQFRHDLLSLIVSSGATRVIMDVSGVMVMDFDEFLSLQQTATMARLTGARTVVAGLRPGVVSSLVELDAPLDWVEAALNLEQAFELFETPNESRTEAVSPLPPIAEPMEDRASEPKPS